MTAIGALVLTPLIWPLGAALLWSSSAWNWRDKLVGTLLPPGGYLPVWLLTTQIHTACRMPCSRPPRAPLHYGPPAVAHVVGGLLVIVLLALPILTTVYLASRLRQPRGLWGVLR